MDARLGPEVWRGGVAAWECDEMGHMNVRFYLARAQEALAGLALRLGLPRAFAPDATATLIVREHHVRFLREAHAGAPLAVTAGLLSMSETEAEALLVMTHALSGEPAAAFRTRLVHATPQGRAFLWPSRAREAAPTLMAEAPAFAQPRSLGSGPLGAEVSLARAEALGLLRTGLGALGPDACDVFGAMRPDAFMGRISDAAPALLAPVRAAVAEASPEVRRIGGAALEYRLIYLERPRAGDHLELRSALSGLDAKTYRMSHWLLDPTSGRPWAVAEAIAASFDLDARKILPMSEPVRAALARRIVPGLRL